MTETISVSDVVLARRSIRGFLDRPVPADVIRKVVDLAGRAPSGGNLQPWHLYVLSGEPLADFKAQMRERLQETPGGEGAEYNVYPPKLVSPYRERRYDVGEQMYSLLGIPREDKGARRKWFANNYQFFGAPLGLFCFVDRRMGPPQWSDLGMYLQTLMLLLREEGLDSCPQESWALYHQTVSNFLGTPEEWMLFCGMAIGYRDPEHPVNELRSERAPLEEVATFLGI